MGAPAEHRVPDDLGLVIEAWGKFPMEMKAAILAVAGSGIHQAGE
jgi:hypothetical protein